MSTELRWTRLGIALLLSCGVMCVGTAAPAHAEQQHRQKKSKKQQPQLPPLPSGPTGPVQQIPLDSIGAVPPQVTFQDNQLTIVAPNSTLSDILRAVHKQTGAEIEVPSAPERVVTHLGPGPARDVMAELLNGSRFNYVLLGSEGNEAALTRVVLVAKTGGVAGPVDSPMGQQDARFKGGQQPPIQQANEQPPQEDMQETEAADDSANADDNGDQQANEGEQQQAPPPDQPGVKTPQQMLQEMQQRQLQLQQQQPPGQPPVPGSGMPPHPPQEN